jgi:hypothetical protein
MAAADRPTASLAVQAPGRGGVPALGSAKVTVAAATIGGAAAAQHGGLSVTIIAVIALLTASLALAGWFAWRGLRRRPDRPA